MNIHALRIFYEISRAGGVSKAAEQLNISQPAVTMQLRKLEKELQMRLTRLEGRNVVLTDAGKWLAAQADRLFALEAEIDKQCIAYQRGSIGSLKISATYLPANYLLPDWLAQYQRSHAAVEISMVSGNVQFALDRLLRYETDMAWIGGSHQQLPANIDFIPVHEDELWFVAHRDHPLAGRSISPVELFVSPFILREPGSYTLQALMSLCRAAEIPEPLPAVRVNGPQEALRAALAGLGITFISAIEARSYVNSGALVRIEAGELKASNVISCCVRAGDPLPPQAQAFLELALHASSTEAT
ncbi:LysR family transcriptional regulator [Paenibacillus woosongensis]|uniref:LysR family transcriptional regulator n=1 Tax=Paenibacillus woosongensis TaxID=307580 RepID=A0AA95L2E3_9BACL|nr:LysR family transcriptional regulator [Paenibacillus woosongensis]WHX51294.1 LysR family transcriptional regulator [Paenibacillus woosongensis]